jgi:hypothetical protein
MANDKINLKPVYPFITDSQDKTTKNTPGMQIILG